MNLEYDVEARRTACEKALEEYEKYQEQVERHDYIVVVNMREPSYRKRLYVVSLEDHQVVRNHHTSHGVNSTNPENKAYAIKFGNTPRSKMSSLGAMKTGKIYNGKHGRSLILEGLEPGVNDNVRKRAVVLHSAHYVTDGYITRQGRAGHSEGCLAVDPAIVKGLIDLISDGVFVYVYY